MSGYPNLGWWVSAHQSAFGAILMDIFGWADWDEDSFCAQDTPCSVQFEKQWKLRMMAQEAAMEEVANGKSRRFLATKNSFRCAGVKIGD